jgi:hypothetical protein
MIQTLIKVGRVLPDIKQLEERSGVKLEKQKPEPVKVAPVKKSDPKKA